MPSPKQEVYADILGLTLPHLRNISSASWWRRVRDRSASYESEFIHSLYWSIFKPDFVSHDIWFLNKQARWYYENCNPALSPIYPQQVTLIRELFALVPPELRGELEWSGPA